MLVFRLFYNIFSFIAALLASVIFLFYKRGRRNFFERFGAWQLNDPEPVIWFHAASAGEVGGIIPLIKILNKNEPKIKTILSCTSPTGLDQAKDFFSTKFLLPFDNYFFIKRILKKFNPRALFITETEIWPELLCSLKQHNIPVFLINARISADFAQKFKYLGWLIAPILKKIKHFYCQDTLTAQRLASLHVSAESLTVVGNTKFDALAQFVVQDYRPRMKNYNKPVIVLGSLRVGEDQVCLPVLKEFEHNFKIVIVPRHLEFVDKLAAALEAVGLKYKKRSSYDELESSIASNDIVLVDTIGELLAYYQNADLAFVGGTLVAGIGGHNPLEPLAFNVPVIMGPHNNNQQSLVAELLREQAIEIVNEANEFAKILMEFLGNNSRFKDQASRGQAYLLSQLGAADKIAQFIAKIVKL